MLKQENAKLKQMFIGMTQTSGHYTQNFEEPPEQPQPKVLKLVDKLEEEQTNHSAVRGTWPRSSMMPLTFLVS